MAIRPEDYVEILQLYTRYRHAVDALDGDGFAACFTPQGTFSPGLGGHRNETFTGREALAALVSDPRNNPPSRHWGSEPLLTEQDDHIASTCYAMVVDVGGDRPFIRGCSVYFDELVRMGGAWLIRTRRSEGDVDVLAG